MIKFFFLLKDLSIENSTSQSALPNRKCDVIFTYSRNRRKKTTSCVLFEQEKALPTKNVTSHPVHRQTILQYSRKNLRTDEKTSFLLEDSSIKNSTSHSALTNRKCDVIFICSRNRRKKTLASPIKNITLQPVNTKAQQILKQKVVLFSEIFSCLL